MKMPTATQMKKIKTLLRVMSIAVPELVEGTGNKRNYASASKLYEELSGNKSQWPDDQELLWTE